MVMVISFLTHAERGRPITTSDPEQSRLWGKEGFREKESLNKSFSDYLRN